MHGCCHWLPRRLCSRAAGLADAPPAGTAPGVSLERLQRLEPPALRAQLGGRLCSVLPAPWLPPGGGSGPCQLQGAGLTPGRQAALHARQTVEVIGVEGLPAALAPARWGHLHRKAAVQRSNPATSRRIGNENTTAWLDVCKPHQQPQIRVKPAVLVATVLL